MNVCRKLTLIALAAGVVAVFTPNASAMLNTEAIRVTFSEPVEVPGKVLPAGTYMFKALQEGTLTQITSVDGTKVYATLFTVPDKRSETQEKSNIVLEKMPEAIPERVQAWFFPGDTVGNEFLYNQAPLHVPAAG